MKRFLLYFITCALVISCSYDDSDLRKELGQLKEELDRIKEQVSQIQQVLSSGGAVTSVEETSDGWVITFSNGKSLEIKQGNSSRIGVKEENGVLYWTVDGEFITDPASGEKIPVRGESGQTPVLGIDQEGFWTVDGVRITGADGKPVMAGGDSIFSNVTVNESSVTFTLGDGSSFTIPLASAIEIVIEGGSTQNFTYGQTREIPFSLADKSAGKMTFSAIASGQWSVSTVTSENGTGGVMTVKAPGADDTNTIMLFASDGNGGTWFTQMTVVSGEAVQEAVDLSASEAANCYIVSAAGRYSFRADIKGNAVSANKDATSRHFDGSIPESASYSATWVWTDTPDMITGISYDNASRRISFSASGQEGNTLIALMDGNRIVWSWHIWATDDPGQSLVQGSSPQYLFMDRNLGATSTDTDMVSSFGFLYQWGRKDPFPSASVVAYTDSALPDGEAFATSVEPGITFNPELSLSWTAVPNNDPSISAGGSVDYSAEHPNVFIAYSAQVGSSGVGSWVNDDNVQYSELWGYDFETMQNTKTMFDPCPPGYKVPSWYREVMADASKETMTVAGEYQSRLYNGGLWPAQGYRTDAGRLSNIGRYGYYWSACSFDHSYPAQNFKGYTLYWYSRAVSNNNAQAQAIGACVRCVREN